MTRVSRWFSLAVGVTVIAGSVLFALFVTDWGALGAFWSGVIEGGVLAVAWDLSEKKARGGSGGSTLASDG